MGCRGRGWPYNVAASIYCRAGWTCLKDRPTSPVTSDNPNLRTGGASLKGRQGLSEWWCSEVPALRLQHTRCLSLITLVEHGFLTREMRVSPPALKRKSILLALKPDTTKVWLSPKLDATLPICFTSDEWWVFCLFFVVHFEKSMKSFEKLVLNSA